MTDPPFTPEVVLRAYTMGVFSMASGEDEQIEWYCPDPRAVLPIEPGGFRVRRSLARRVRSGVFTVTRDRDFEAVIRACAEPRPSGGEWISEPIIDVYCELHRRGFAHSVEAWESDGDKQRLAGGLYGVAIGGAFFGESMFSRTSDASQVCLVRLVEHLRDRGFTLLDVQFTNPHLEQFGVIEIAHAEYARRLAAALQVDCAFGDR